MNGEMKDKVIRIITCLVVAVIATGGFVMMYPNYRRSESLKRQNAELRERVEQKKREIDELVDKQRRFRSDSDFVEGIARQNHRVFPGELIFIFNED